MKDQIYKQKIIDDSRHSTVNYLVIAISYDKIGKKYQASNHNIQELNRQCLIQKILWD